MLSSLAAGLSFDWTISVGTVLSVAGGITMAGVSIGRILRRMEKRWDRLEQTLQEFPPHQHINEHIRYPKGMAPAVSEEH